jgi:hypothetical protein
MASAIDIFTKFINSPGGVLTAGAVLAGTARELDLASALFHRINRIIPENQIILSVPPNCLVRDAVALMRNRQPVTPKPNAGATFEEKTTHRAGTISDMIRSIR